MSGWVADTESDPNEEQLLVQELLRDYQETVNPKVRDRILPEEIITVMNSGTDDAPQQRSSSQQQRTPNKFLFQRANHKGQDPVIQEVSWSQTSQAEPLIDKRQKPKISSVERQPPNFGVASLQFPQPFATKSQPRVSDYRSEQQPTYTYHADRQIVFHSDFSKKNPAKGYSSVGVEKPGVHNFSSNNPVGSSNKVANYLLQTQADGALASGYTSASQSHPLNKYYNYLESLLGTLPSAVPMMTRAVPSTVPAKVTGRVSIKKVRKAVQGTQRVGSRYDRQGESEHLFYEELDKDYETPVECLDLDTAKPDADISEDYGGEESTRKRHTKKTPKKIVSITKVKKYVDGLEASRELHSSTKKKTKVFTKSTIRPDDWKDERFQSAFKASSKEKPPTSTLNSSSKKPLSSSKKTPQKLSLSTQSPVTQNAHPSSATKLPMSPTSLNKHLRKEKEKRIAEQERRVKALEEQDRKRLREEEEVAKTRREEERKARLVLMNKRKAEEEERVRTLKNLQRMQVEEAKKTLKEQQEFLLAKNGKEREIRRMSKGQIPGIDDVDRVRTASENSRDLGSESQRTPLTQNINLSLVPVAETGGSEQQLSREVAVVEDRKDTIMIEEFDSQPAQDPIPQPNDAIFDSMLESAIVARVTDNQVEEREQIKNILVADSLAFSLESGVAESQVPAEALEGVSSADLKRIEVSRIPRDINPHELPDTPVESIVKPSIFGDSTGFSNLVSGTAKMDEPIAFAKIVTQAQLTGLAALTHVDSEPSTPESDPQDTPSTPIINKPFNLNELVTPQELEQAEHPETEEPDLTPEETPEPTEEPQQTQQPEEHPAEITTTNPTES